jgi:hypothetical protein
LVHGFVVTAITRHELPPADLPDDEYAASLTFELNGIILAANMNFVVTGDPAALALPRALVRRRLGVAA